MNKALKLPFYNVKGSILLSLFLSAIYFYGDLILTEIQFPIEIGKILLVFIVYYLVINLLYTGIKKIKLSKKEYKINYKIVFLLLLACWLSHLIVKYPAANNYDPYYQICQVLGYFDLSTHHPLTSTLLIGGFTKLGISLGDINVGLFLFVVVQMLVQATVFTYVISYVDTLKQKWLTYLTIGFYAFNPYITGYIGQTIKDIYYSTFFVLVFISLIRIIEDKNSIKDKKWIILFFIGMSGICLFRNDGKIIAIVVAIIVSLYYKKTDYFKKALIISLICIVIPVGFDKSLQVITNAKSGSIREVLSVPFQQTARTVLLNEDVYSEEDKEIIDKVLPYNQLKDLYCDYKVDSVKDSIKVNTFNEDIVNFIKVWAKTFIKAPREYIEAFASQNVYILYPSYNIHKINVTCNAPNDDFKDISIFETPDSIEKYQSTYKNFMMALFELPVLSYLNNISVYTILMLIFCLYLINDHKEWYIFIPFLFVILIISVGPTIKYLPRYLFPFLYTMPLWIAYTIKKLRKEYE